MSLQRPALVKNGNTGSANALKYAHFAVKLAARLSAGGKIIAKDTEFGLIGDNTVTDAEMEEAGAIMAARFAKLSSAVIVNMWKKIGKYRNDEVPGVKESTLKRYAIIYQTNNPLAENPNYTGVMPLKTVTGRFFLPWQPANVSEQDIVESITAPITVNAKTIQLGVTKFANDAKTEISGYPLDINQGVTTKRYTRVNSFELVNNDTVDGLTDGVISEAHASLIPGDDDGVI